MFKSIALFVGLVIVAVLVYAATRPDNFQVQRTAVINAPPEKIYSLIADLHQWASWSPFEKLDPAMKKTFGGAESGKGAAYAWEGNSKAGQGRMEIVDTSAPTRVVMKLDFIKPIEGHNIVEFMLEPQGAATQVTWAMNGPSPYIAKVIGIFCNMDNMIGKDFATGLTNLKSVAENSAVAAQPAA